MATNINQTARWCNLHQTAPDDEAVEAMIGELTTVIDRFRDAFGDVALTDPYGTAS